MKRRSLKVQLLKWILCRRGRVVTCQVDRAGNRYRVSVLPQGQHKSRLVEMFDANVMAFQRHAALVTDLRDRGWTTLAYR
jgi:hypothetical protein